jgi:hypothetical protein
MGWDKKSVYDALIQKGNYPKKGDLNKYVSLDHHRLRSLNSILYSWDSSYERAPVHVNKGRASFSEEFFGRISSALELRSPGSHGWEQYSVIDWAKLARGLGLEPGLKLERGKGALKDHDYMYKNVKSTCIECFQKLGDVSKFTRDGNIISCMKEKMSADWPQNWIEWVVKNAGQIVKGVEIEK